MKSNKFGWESGDVKATMSQCSDCEFNKSATGCAKYGTKPIEYLDNKEQCPEYEKE